MNKQFYSALIAGMSGVLLLAGCSRDPLSSAIREMEQGRLQKAELILTQILQEDPGNIDASMNLAIVQLKNGQQDTALARFLQVADQVPNDARPLEYAAGIQMDNNQWTEAATLLNEAFRRSPNSPSVQTALALVELNTAGALPARDHLLKIITDSPSYPPALFNLGVINRDWIKNSSEAKKYFQRYLAVEKNDPHVIVARTAMSEKMRRPIASPALASEPTLAPPVKRTTTPPITKRNPQLAAEAFSQGVQHHQAHENDKAIEAYTRAIQNDPTLGRAHYNLGLLLRDKRNLAQAHTEFEQALAYAPGMSDARYMLALVLIDQGQDGEAIKQLNALLEKAPQHAEAHLALGLLYKKDPSKRSLAKKELSTYLKFDPNGATSKEIRNWLKYLQ